MAEWTPKELEELLEKMTQKSMTDAEFRKEVLADATKALEKLAGRPLPDGSSLKCIEKDPNYQTTLVLPDLLDEEKIDDEALAQVAGGISVAMIVSFCAGAIAAGPDVGQCAMKLCTADACAKYSGVGMVTICITQACWNDTTTSPEDCITKACDNYEHQFI